MHVTDFKITRKFIGRNLSNQSKTPEEIQSYMFQQFIKVSILSVSGRSLVRMKRNAASRPSDLKQKIYFSGLTPFEYHYSIHPNYYCFKNCISSNDNPIFDVALGHYLMSVLPNFGEPEDENILVRNALLKQTLHEILVTPDKNNTVYEVLRSKSDVLFKTMEGKIKGDNFEKFLFDFLEKNKFKTVTVDDFLKALKKNSGFDFTTYLYQWYNERQFPKFEVYDAKRIRFIGKEKIMYNFIFKIYNSGSTDGTIQAWIGGQYDNVHRTFHLEANQAKEIGLIADLPERYKTIGFETYNALNDKYLHISTGKLKYSQNEKPFDGERIVEIPQKLINPKVIIVDNLDQGFAVLTQPRKCFIMKLLNKSGPEDEEIEKFSFRRPPGRWRAGFAGYFYGESEKTAHYIKSGKGEQKVRWKAELPENGTYDIYFYTPVYLQFRIPAPGEAKYAVEDFDFRVYHDEGVDEVALDLSKAKSGWTYIGIYSLSQGTAKVELTDKSKGRVVYADAVKWGEKIVY